MSANIILFRKPIRSDYFKVQNDNQITEVVLLLNEHDAEYLAVRNRILSAGGYSFSPTTKERN